MPNVQIEGQPASGLSRSNAELDNAITGTKMVTISGKMFEIGILESGSGRGLRMESDGEVVEITGLSKAECRRVAKLLGKQIEITIAVPNVI